MVSLGVYNNIASTGQFVSPYQHRSTPVTVLEAETAKGQDTNTYSAWSKLVLIRVIIALWVLHSHDLTAWHLIAHSF